MALRGLEEVVKAFLKILLWGFAAFMVASIVQEWDFFSNAWFGEKTPPASLSDAQKKGAAEAVYQYLKMTSHLYGSGGDRRFAERIAAVPQVVNETLAEIDYLRRNGRVQDPVLVKMEPLAVESLGPGVQVKTKEFWVCRTFRIGSDIESDPTRSEIVFAKYRLEADGQGWRVMAWDFEVSPAPLEGLALPPSAKPVGALEPSH